MSVIPVGERSADPSGVETYDSGDDWEIGVGDLIIDLDADLEKDRQKLEMNRLGSAKGSTKEYEGMGSACANAATSAAASDGLAFASAQPSVPQGSGGAREGGRGKVKRSKTPRDASKSASPSAPYGAPETCAGASQDAQGRSVEAPATMNPAPGQAVGGARASGEQCARGKEEKSGRTQSRSAKRERDGGSRAKRERQDAAHASWQLGNVYAPGSKGSPCGSGDGGGAGDTAKNGVDCGVMDSAGVGKRSDDDTAAAPAKRPKADKKLTFH